MSQTSNIRREQRCVTVDCVHATALVKALAVAGLTLLAATQAQAAINCLRQVTANVVAFDKPLMYNRLGASNVNGMMFALKRDVVDASGVPLTVSGAVPTPGTLDLRPDKRHRPLVLRVRRGDCLTVNLTNLLTGTANPNNALPRPAQLTTAAGQEFTVAIDEQVKDRAVTFHASGMQVIGSINDDGSYVGANTTDSYAMAGDTTPYTYKLYAEREGAFNITGGVSFGADGNMGNVSNGLFGQLVVEPTGAKIYRSQVHEEELRLAADVNRNGVLDPTEKTAYGQPKLTNYEATYPTSSAIPTVWDKEGKGGLPVLNMMKCTSPTTCEIVHSEINAVIAGPNANGRFPKETYPLENAGQRNPTVPNRLEPFREYAQVWHDEQSAAQAFPGFYRDDPVFKYVLAGVKDAFMINYGSGGIGSEIIANRLGVGPMHDCLSCNYEEFFLTSFTVGDPALTVDVPANRGLEACGPSTLGTGPCLDVGPKANYVIGAEDPSNVAHSYIGDFVKFRNTHIGKEQHVFHLHNHQWLYNPNDDNANYLDAQSVGPGVGYTYEINFGGSGNRNKSAGDAIFHCHFYPHFAQGMWYHWRNHDVFEAGTILDATPAMTDAQGFATANGYHSTKWGLAVAKPKMGSRAYPDGEISAGTPIPAIVPLPGKPMAVMPGRVTTKANELMAVTNLTKPVGSLAKVLDRNLNPGFPFWIAGIEDIVGQRPPTPVLDMITKDQAAALKGTTAAPGDPLWQQLNPNQADGWDGGLPRHALKGYAAGGTDAAVVISPIDFSKVMAKADLVGYPEEGTDLEQVAMAFHALRCHDSFNPDGTAATCTGGIQQTLRGLTGMVSVAQSTTTVSPTGVTTTVPGTTSGGFITNGGGGPVVGAPFHNSCIDDRGIVLKPGVVGSFFSGEVAHTNFATGAGLKTKGSSVFNSDTPRIYKGAFMQFDAVFNKVGYHYPQERIVALWQDVAPVISKTKAPEPLVFRMNTFDCTVYHNTNLVPSYYEIDDYQVRTPTDIIGQHIHLPKWDLTTADGAANGWNYEDGAMSPGMIQERIHAIRTFNACGITDTRDGTLACPVAKDHPYFSKVASTLGAGFPAAWLGARTITERWFTDPVVNTEGVDRGLGIVFTHDHYGPSTHQQIGLYATLLTEPAGSKWVQNETGKGLGCTTVVNTTTPAASLTPDTTPCRWDGGPTSWQAAIIPPANATGGSNVKAETLKNFREFYLEFSDFQHAYEAGVYVGAGQNGLPLTGTGASLPPVATSTNPQLTSGDVKNAFRFAINPPARAQIAPVFPDLVLELANTTAPGTPAANNFCPSRPCPGAISVEDPGMLVVNYRNEPVGLRVYDPKKLGPDGKLGAQAGGLNSLNVTVPPRAGDLAFALQSRTDRAIPALNVQPLGGTTINGTKFPPPINVVKEANATDPLGAVQAGDPFTPMLRAYSGDPIRIKMQAGGHEEEHNASLHGLKWLQGGSGHGSAPNSGWRNGQAAGISEQFSLSAPVMSDLSTNRGASDYAWSVDTGNDGWWSGMWGLLRTYNRPNATLFHLPGKKPQKPFNLSVFVLPAAESAAQGGALHGVCPTSAPRRNYDVSVVLANDVLGNSLGVTIPASLTSTTHAGGPLKGAGGTLVYNHRAGLSGVGPLHDPTAIMYVLNSDLDVITPATLTQPEIVRLKATAPVEPLVLRAAAGECINVTLRNRLPATVPDLATYSTLLGVVKRDRLSAQGSTTFNNNLIRASSHVGMHPQLVEYDVTRNDGANVGNNPVQTVAPGDTRMYQWYAGDHSLGRVDADLLDSEIERRTIIPTPIEFGGVNLMPADKMKQGAKSLVGAMVIEPAGATWTEDTLVFNHQDGAGTRKTRAQATVCPPSAGATAGPVSCAMTAPNAFRDFSLVLTKANTHYYKDGTPVEHMNGEGVGIPEDSQEASGMLLNYGIEPMWFRYGIVPQAPFSGPDSYGSIGNAHAAYSNSIVGYTDPVTPVFIASAGREARVRITNPYGTTRGSTFAMHGHLWQRDPYVCPGEARNTLTGACRMGTVPSRAIGVNPQGFYEAGRESWTPASHFDIVLPSAGGGNGITGDYLYRDAASFGNASGLWGIMRVK